MSHGVGVGPPLPEELVRAGMLVRVNQFCQGTSGVSPAVAERLVDLLNHDICPWVPEKGSLGASGDVAPSANVGLVLIGEGDVVHKGERRSGAEALRAAGLQLVELRAKDALSVLNGTHFMTGAASLVLHDAQRLLLTADVVAALSVEALRGSRTAFDPRIHAARPHPGQVASAAHIFALTQGSGIVESHVLCDRVQDAYSLRCAAQVHGACHDAIDYLGRVLAVELNAGTDNPLVFADDEAVLSGGNFHGEPLALALDTASIGLSELGSISERRLFRMLTGFLSELPAFLTRHSGLDSGYMLLQYTAAALATDNQLLATPASVHSLPTSADQEDHNSMGWHSAQRARQVATNVEAILAPLRRLKDDETLLVQSGKPVGIFATHEYAPRVLIANSLLVPRWATWEKFWELERLGLIMYGQMTAGSWIYIGSQGILQGTYETFGALAAKRFDGTLRGRIVLTSGLGGMGRAQPLAVTMHEGVALCVEIDATRIERRLKTRYLDKATASLDDAIKLAEDARPTKSSTSIAVVGNAAQG